MPKIKREYTIALVVAASIGLLIFGVNFLKGLNLFQKKNVFYAVYNDVSGVTDASPVLFHGYKVGQVIRTEMLPDGSGRIAVEFQLSEKQLKLPKNTEVEIFSADLFTRAIQIILGTGTDMAQPGDTLTGGSQPSLTDQLDPIKARAQGMLASIDSVLISVQGVFAEGGTQDLHATFSGMKATMENLRMTTKRIDDLLAAESETIRKSLENLGKVSTTLAANSQRIDHIFGNVDSLTSALASGDLDKTLTNMSAVSEKLKGVMTDIDQGKGTLGKLAKDDSLYHNLNSATHELDLMLEDFRVNPNRYVHLSLFGKRDKLPKLSEADIERIQQAYQKKQGQ